MAGSVTSTAVVVPADTITLVVSPVAGSVVTTVVLPSALAVVVVVFPVSGSVTVVLLPALLPEFPELEFPELECDER